MSNQRNTANKRIQDIKISVNETNVDQDDQILQESSANNKPKEIGGPKGLEPTRYGDWESKGRCYDF